MNVSYLGNTQLMKPQQKMVSQPVSRVQSQAQMVSFTGDKEVKEQKPKLAVMKNLAKGFIKPIKDIGKAIVEAPLATGAIVAATAAVIHFLPVVGTLLAVGIAGAGAVKIVSSIGQAVKAKKEGDLETAQKEIRDIGEGTFDVALTANAAIKGIKEVAGSIQAILDASKAAAVEGKTISTVQKVYSIVKQVQSDKAVSRAPKKFETMLNKLKQDGVKELELLKSPFKAKKSTAKLESLIDKVNDAGKKEQLIQLLDAAKEATTKTNLGKQVDKMVGILRSEGITNVNTTQLAEIIEIVKDEPSILAVLNGAMKVGTVDDAARAVNKVVGSTRFSDDAVKVVATADALENN